MPQSTPGWTDSELELIKIQFLETASLKTKDGEVPDAWSYGRELTENSDLLRTAAMSLVDEGLLNREGSVGGGIGGVWPTDRGHALIQTRRERRPNRKLRMAACRDALLDYIYVTRSNADLDGFLGDVRGHFEGDPFTADEAEDAATDLQDKGYITSKSTLQNSFMAIEITTTGKTVVEDHNSSARSFESGESKTRASQTTVHIEGGTFSGQFTVGDHNQITQNTGAVDSGLVELIKAVVEAASGTGAEERVAKLIAQLQLEVDEETPEPTIMTTTLDRLQETASKAGSGALVLAVDRLIGYISEHGIPQMLGMG